MNPTFINLGFFEVRWYSIFILLGFVIGYFLVIDGCKKKNIERNVISDLCFYLVIVCILGARLYYCLFNLEYYSKNPIEILKVWEGGLAIHGGIIAGMIFIFFYAKHKKLDILRLFDVFAPALVLGQAIGRWGNFFNGEAFGPAISLSKLKSFFIPNFIIDGMNINGVYHQPTFLYESVGCFIIFIIIMIICNKKTIKKGQIAGLYFILYGIIRLFIESLRQDSLMFLNLRAAQLVSIFMILSGIFLIIIPYLRGNYDK